jgi:hypothetical protein
LYILWVWAGAGASPAFDAQGQLDDDIEHASSGGIKRRMALDASFLIANNAYTHCAEPVFLSFK